MKLYLVQHGEAKSEAEDPERPLTDRGKSEVSRIAKLAEKMGLNPAKIYHSGKLRAKQTAEHLAGALQRPSEVASGLNPMDDVRLWADRLAKGKEDLMLVGHLPFMEKLASYLLCGNENARLVLFRHGAIVCLDQKEDQAWAVRWILTPEMIPQ
jgi:phosphohistidine phosphatase